jgi:WD40 repeat protein
VLAPLLGDAVVDWSVDIASRTSGEVDARLDQMAERATPSTALVWVGHGNSKDRSPALFVPGVQSSPKDAELLPSKLGAFLVAQSRRRAHLDPRPWTLVLVEACGAGRFVELVNAHLLAEGGVRGVALIGIGDPNGNGHTASAGRILGKVVASFDPNNTIIRLSDFLTEVDERLGGGLWGLVASCTLGGYAIERPQLVLSATLDVYTELRRALQGRPAAVQAHFARKGMGADFGELSWSFVGRTQERARIVEHLRRGHGLLAVTGPAGSGKSAVLGNVMLRSQPDLLGVLVAAGFLDEDPPTPDEAAARVDAWIHLSGLTSREVAESLSTESGMTVEAAATEDQLVESLVASQQRRRLPLHVVADALDESRDPGPIAQILRRLVDAGACIVVGTRPSGLEEPDHPAPDAHDLLDSLGAADAELLWVRRDPEALRTYLVRGFARGLSTLAPALQDRIIASICNPQQSQPMSSGPGREFLYARLLLGELATRPNLGDSSLDALLAGNHRTIFAAAMNRLASEHPAVAVLLEALSHAQGNGIPRVGSVWATVARRLSGRAISPDDIDEALERGAPYIAISAENGQAVYHLAHRTFQEHFEESWTAEAALRVASGLIDLADQPGDPNPYLVAYLAGHVGRAAQPGWELLAEHEALLDVIDPNSMVRELMRTSFGLIAIPPALSGVMARADVPRDCAPEDRQGIRQLNTAWFTSGETTNNDPATWSILAAVRPRRTPHLTLTGHTGPVSAVAAFTGPDGRTLLATSSYDMTVRVWDPVTVRPVGPPLTGHTGRVTAVTAFTGPDGRTLLATGSWDKTVRVWDPATGRPVGPPLTGHTALVSAVAAFTGPDGRTLLATGSWDKTVRVWDPTTGQQVLTCGRWRLLPWPRLKSHTGPVTAVAAFTGPDGRTLLATGSYDRTVRVWDPTTGHQVGTPLTGHTALVSAVAAFTGPDGRTLLATGSSDKTVRVWDPATGHQVGTPLTGHTDVVTAVAAFTGPDGRTLLATGSYDRVVRVWDPATGRPVGTPLTGHTGPVTEVTAFTGPDGRTLLATGSYDETVRVWGPASRLPLHRLGLRTSVTALVAMADGTLVVGLPDGWARIRLPTR